MRVRIKILIFAFLFCAGVVPAQNAVDAMVLDAPSSMVNSETAIIENASRALDMGLPALSRILSERLVNSTMLEHKDEARLLLVDSMIAEGRFEQAKKELQFFDLRNDPEIILRRAIIANRMREGTAKALLSGLNPKDLSDRSRAWYYIVSGMSFFDEGNFKSALSDFNEAKKQTKSPVILAEAEVLANLCKMSSDLEADDLKSLSEDLSVKSSIFMGMPAGAQFAKQYAIVLDRLGMKKEALEVIENQLEVSLLADSDRDELRLIGAFIEPSAEGKLSMLLSVLKSTRSPEVIEQAIYLLRYAYDYAAPEYASALADALKNSSELVRDRILLELAYLALRKGDYSAVDLYSNRLLTDYPASLYTLDAYRLLALSAFASGDSKRPDYRLAANYLLKIVSFEKDPDGADIARFLAADSYFLDQDYDTAAAMYASLINSKLPQKWKGGAFSRAVESLLHLGRLDEAVALADSAYGRLPISSLDMWKAEWAISNAYWEKNDMASAYARVERLLAGPASASADPELRVRLLWLQARLADNSGNVESALRLTEDLIAQIKEGRLALSGDFSNTALSSLMLLRARHLSSLDRMDGQDGAFAAYEALRKEYPLSDAAQISYLYEARNFASRGAFAQAQQHCKTLVDNFPNGHYADIALYEAAMYSRRLGLESDYKDAMSLLDRIVKNYPSSPKVFYAKLAYAEILRVMGDFANAAAVYKNILDEFPSHPRIVAAQIGLGDSLLAGSGHESDAAAIFERIYSSPDMPREAKAEAAFKWGFALDRAGRKSEAARIWWISASDFLSENDKEADTALNGKERYWVARSLMQLARSLEHTDEKNSAAAAYELIVKYNLPGAYTAREKLLKAKEK